MQDVSVGCSWLNMDRVKNSNKIRYGEDFHSGQCDVHGYSNNSNKKCGGVCSAQQQ